MASTQLDGKKMKINASSLCIVVVLTIEAHLLQISVNTHVDFDIY